MLSCAYFLSIFRLNSAGCYIFSPNLMHIISCDMTTFDPPKNEGRKEVVVGFKHVFNCPRTIQKLQSKPLRKLIGRFLKALVPIDDLLNQYMRRMYNYQQASPETIEVRCHLLSQFLKWFVLKDTPEKWLDNHAKETKLCGVKV